MIKKKDFEDKGFIKSENGYIVRIHVLLWLEIDENGFCEIRRKIESKLIKKNICKITLPKPVRNKKELTKLIEVLM